MIEVLTHNITSPLGNTTSANLEAVIDGSASILHYKDHRGVPGDYVASLFDDEVFNAMPDSCLSRLESIALSSATKAIADSGININNQKTLFILSTTKGNIEWLDDDKHEPERILPSSSAKTIASRLGITSTPIVVDNACISGLSAIITACRLLERGIYDYAVVCGVEIQSKFIISGFQSLKATSPEPCRPFDIERMGLNLGEAAATLVLSRKSHGKPWGIVSGCQRNDAYHLSAPSKDAKGARLALEYCTKGVDTDDIAFINAHGTATLFNDQMESVAIENAGLNSIPVNGFKGYYGHTMGACGVLETILSMAAIDNEAILPTKGFKELGVSGKIDVVSNLRKTVKKSFVKMLSGFGGGNACLLVSKDIADAIGLKGKMTNTVTTHNVHITENLVEIDNNTLSLNSTGKSLLTELYKKYVGDYPRFYKMDILCRLGFIATELLLQAEGKQRFLECDDRATILVGHHGSIVADRNYLMSISNPEDYFPSPERFVYTLPNIVTGEIAIRNHYHGETGYYYLDERNDEIINNIIKSAFQDSATKSAICGWIDCENDEHFEADLHIKVKK